MTLVVEGDYIRFVRETPFKLEEYTLVPHEDAAMENTTTRPGWPKGTAWWEFFTDIAQPEMVKRARAEIRWAIKSRDEALDELREENDQLKSDRKRGRVSAANTRRVVNGTKHHK